LCSICERLAEYIERFSTDLRRSTKKTATMPTIATSGPARRYAIGADYRGSALCLALEIDARIRGSGAGRRSCVTIATVALYDRIQSEMVDARKRRDDVALGTLSLLKSELVRASKEGAAGGRIDDELVKRVARKEVKRREEAIDVYRKAGREDSARREEAELALLRGFLPAAMSEQEIEAEVRAVIAELKPDGPKGFGLVMKAATARLAGRADGNQVAAVARRLLGS
jgi:uncharacterized protein